MDAARIPPLLSRRSLLGHLGLGHLTEFQKSPWTVLRRFNAECGDLGRISFLGNTLLVVNTPELVGELLVAKAARFRKSPVIRAALYPIVGEGLFTSEGELWRRQRRLMAPLFHPARVAESATVMSDAAVRAAASWRDGAELDVARETTRIAMAVAGRALFDVDTFDEADTLGDALTTALHWSAETAMSVTLGLQFELAARLGRLTPALPGPLRARGERAAQALGTPLLWPSRRNRAHADARAIIDRRVARMIAERRAASAPAQDLLSQLLHAQDAEAGAGAMSDRQLRDEVVTLFVAGHETTATALAWALYLLGRTPEAYRRLEAEVAALGGAPATAADLPRLPYAAQVFKEALRLYPPVPVYERQALEPVDIGGYRVPEGGYCTVFPWALHHRPELYPDPDRFLPERFTPEAEERRPRHAFVPFGAGPRVCIGNHFALLEGPLVLATLLGRAHLEPCDSRPVEPDPSAATTRPLGPIRMRVLLRRPTAL
ncbi:MAG: cytochrome P450 [Myxococcales bacterium]|nr:cytochrome P450 [Myxococcales bacterium]